MLTPHQIKQKHINMVAFCETMFEARLNVPSSCPIMRRVCEYDEDELEYWVNTRTSATLAREDLQRLSVSQTHEGEGSNPVDIGGLDMGMNNFPDVDGAGAAPLQVEGDSNLQETWQQID